MLDSWTMIIQRFTLQSASKVTSSNGDTQQDLNVQVDVYRGGKSSENKDHFAIAAAEIVQSPDDSDVYAVVIGNAGSATSCDTNKHGTYRSRRLRVHRKDRNRMSSECGMWKQERRKCQLLRPWHHA